MGNNTESTDIEADRTQYLTVLSVSDQFSEINENHTERDGEYLLGSAAPPPSYDLLVSDLSQPTLNHQTETEETPPISEIPPPSYNSLVSNPYQPSQNYQAESDDENTHESPQNLIVTSVSGRLSELDENHTVSGDENHLASVIPPPSYESLVTNSTQISLNYQTEVVDENVHVRAESSQNLIPVLLSVSDRFSELDEIHMENGDENLPTSVIPPPSYDSLMSNSAEQSQSSYTESGDENTQTGVIPTPSFDNFVTNSTQPFLHYDTEIDDENIHVPAESSYTPTPLAMSVSDQFLHIDESHMENGDENVPTNVIPPPSYDSLLSNPAQHSQNSYTESGNENHTESVNDNHPVNEIPPPSYESLIPIPSQPPLCYEESQV
jgi:hypothetical protein